MTTTFALKFRHTPAVETFATYEEALAAIHEVFDLAEVGHPGDISEGGERTLVWADAEAADGDDGSRAIAEIRVRHSAEVAS